MSSRLEKKCLGLGVVCLETSKNRLVALLLFFGWIPIVVSLLRIGLITSAPVLMTEVASSLAVAMIVGAAHVWKSVRVSIAGTLPPRGTRSEIMQTRSKSHFRFYFCVQLRLEFERQHSKERSICKSIEEQAKEKHILS
ncbi:MAG: hypothetical protein JRN20_14970 [Nitrososphaerota archaeon]|nr:hypothetical protein [Nitrososphaerota archaeon]